MQRTHNGASAQRHSLFTFLNAEKRNEAEHMIAERTRKKINNKIISFMIEGATNGCASQPYSNDIEMRANGKQRHRRRCSWMRKKIGINLCVSK